MARIAYRTRSRPASRGGASLGAALIAIFSAMLALMACAAEAQAPEQTTVLAKTLDTARQSLDRVDRALDGPLDRSERQDLRDRATAVALTANDAVTALQAQLQLVDARIGQLGPPTPGVVEAPDIIAQRKVLAQQRSTVDSEIKRGRLLAVNASQLRDEIAAAQAEQFNQRMSVRAASPLSPAFWQPVLRAFPRDANRTAAFVSNGAAHFAHGLGAGRSWFGLAGLVLALIVLVPVRARLRQAGRRYLIAQARESRVRRAGFALWLALTGTLIPGIAAIIFVQGLRWGGLLTRGWDAMASTMLHATFVGAAISALGGALLQRHEPGWRMLPIDTEAAARLRIWAWVAAIVTVVSLLFMRLNDLIGVSGPASAAGDAAVALAYILLIAGILLTIGRLRAAAMRAHESATAPARRTGMTVASLAGWTAALGGLIALLLGYLSLARFVAFMAVWVTVVGAALYLLLNAADVISTSLFSRKSHIGRSAHYGLGIRESAIDQFGVLLSAFLRMLLVMVALGVLMTPFGTDVGSLFGTIWSLAHGVAIGQVTISPAAIVRAIVVLAIGLFGIRIVQGWLTSCYLPSTELDPSARNSISMIARYTGIVLAVLWALASLGIGLERIALLLSALSVGIGFGLQAITQNFVSGLILLAERPVKIGDWVRIGDQEGDVIRISVRATEIQVADRSTLIVPNSELITKTIQNMTLADPIGRIQLQISVPLGTDAARVRAMLIDIMSSAAGVRPAPAPAAFIDQIVDGRVSFNCFAYVESPRAAYATRSDMLLEILQRFAAEGIDIGLTAQRLEFSQSFPESPRGDRAQG